jgi:FG-GAP-like repeat
VATVNRLYHNNGNGNGTFTDVTEASGTGGPTTPGQHWATSAAWVDLDNDGKLDLVVLRYVVWDFDDIWCGEHREGYRTYCHPDLFPAISALVYHNDGNGHFTEVAKKIGMDTPGKGLGIAISTTMAASTQSSLRTAAQHTSCTTRPSTPIIGSCSSLSVTSRTATASAQRSKSRLRRARSTKRSAPPALSLLRR